MIGNNQNKVIFTQQWLQNAATLLHFWSKLSIRVVFPLLLEYYLRTVLSTIPFPSSPLRSTIL